MQSPHDPEALDAFLVEQGGLEPDPDATVSPLGDGNANETLLVDRDDAEYVVRLPPAIDVAPYLLHDLLREYEVLDALEATPVPTPTVVAACEDESVLGDQFYVMERVPGDVMTDSELDRIDDEQTRRAVGTETVDSLAALHGLDPDAVGLGDWECEDHPIEASLDRLSAQLEWAIERTASARRDASRVHGSLEETLAWLRENVPEPVGGSVVHGDYKLDNLLWAPGLPVELGAVLDWEMSRLGDPRTDLGWFLAFWYESRDPDPLTDSIRETYADHDYVDLLEVFVHDYSRFMEHDDYPSRRALVDRYESRTETEFSNERFFRVLAVFKLAAILESFYRTYLEHPEHAKPTYPAMELLVPTLAVSAERIVAGEVPL